MKQKIIPYIYTLFLVVFSSNFFAQQFTLKIASKKNADTPVLEKVIFQKTHLDSLSIYNEIDTISNYLKNIGYFTNTIDMVSKIDTIFTAYFLLGEKINTIIIRNKLENDLNIFDFKKEKDTIIIPIRELQFTLNSISRELDNQGKSFSTIQLSNLITKGTLLFADLIIRPSKKRKINKVIVKGYDKFSKSHIKHQLYIKENTLFNKEKIKEISTSIQSLPFVREIKYPEVLFTKDSTLLYIYLKKHPNNSFNGLINFTSKENGGLLFNGHLDLKLSNILNTGEHFSLFWNSIGEEKQEFRISSEVPYIFNTALTPKLSFNIYKQDSTFLNTEFKTRISYNINSKIKIAATYTSITSKNLQQNLTFNNIEEFQNSFLGIYFLYSSPKNDAFQNDIFFFEINPTFGNRNSTNNSTKQFKIEFTTNYIWDINFRNSLFIKNNTGYLKSDNFLENELFRIGGANSIRGFNEQSIFANNFSIFNIEYRFLTSQSSYLYTITDIARIKTATNTQNVLGLGLGYLFKTKNSQINLSTAIGRTSSNAFDFKNSKIIINWKNYF